MKQTNKHKLDCNCSNRCNGSKRKIDKINTYTLIVAAVADVTSAIVVLLLLLMMVSDMVLLTDPRCCAWSNAKEDILLTISVILQLL